MHLFKSLWITQTLDALSKVVSHTGMILKIQHPPFLKEMLLPGTTPPLVPWWVSVTANGFSCSAMWLGAWEDCWTSIFLVQMQGGKSRDLIPLLWSRQLSRAVETVSSSLWGSVSSESHHDLQWGLHFKLRLSPKEWRQNMWGLYIFLKHVLPNSQQTDGTITPSHE